MASDNFLIRYGKFSGPSYSGGVVLGSGQNITVTQTAVPAVNFIDSLAKQHDVNYQYFEKVFAGNPAALNRAQWEADKAAVMSALQFTPTNWIERGYHELFINEFIAKAQSSLAGYGSDPTIVTEAKALQLQVSAIDPSVRQLGTMQALFGANANMRFALLDVITSDLSSQEIMFFNGHLKSLSDVVMPNTSPEGGLPIDSNDFTHRPINPTSDGYGNLVATVRIGDNLVAMTLNKDTHDFTKVVSTLSGELLRSEAYVATDVDTVAYSRSLGYRAYNYTEKDATGTPVRSLFVEQPPLSSRLLLDGDADRLAAVNAGVNAQGKYDNANTTIPTFVAIGFVPPNTPQITPQVSGTSLLANDTLGGFAGSNLSVSRVSNFNHGTSYLDANGFVHFNPSANYSGTDAGFDYGVRAVNGQISTATVQKCYRKRSSPRPFLRAAAIKFFQKSSKQAFEGIG